MFGTNGRFYTLGCDGLPGGRGNGEPLRLMIELGGDADVVSMMVHRPGARMLVASDAGRGFIVAENDVLAQTRNGKQVLNLGTGEEAASCVTIPEGADSVAVIGENRKMLIFGLDELPEMTRGKGVMLQRYRDGGMGDVKVFARADGLSWRAGTRTRTETNLLGWIGKRGGAGRLPPPGFPRANRFT